VDFGEIDNDFMFIPEFVSHPPDEIKFEVKRE
jgi:hypothetical protein